MKQGRKGAKKGDPAPPGGVQVEVHDKDQPSTSLVVYQRPSGPPADLEDPRIQEILEVLIAGDPMVTLKAACEGAGVTQGQFGWWVAKDTPRGLAGLYVRARDIGYEVMAEALPKLCEEAETLARVPFAGGAIVQAVKLKVDTIKWLLAKRRPQTFGDKVDVTSGGQPLQRQVMVIGGRTVEF